jgi:hypothetical protein
MEQSFHLPLAAAEHAALRAIGDRPYMKNGSPRGLPFFRSISNAED